MKRILIIVLVIFLGILILGSIFYYLNLKKIYQGEDVTKNIKLVFTQYDKNVWKVEDGLITTKIKKDGNTNVFNFKIGSFNVQREIHFVENFPKGVRYKLRPEKLIVMPNQKIDVVLEISADKSVKENEISFKFDGVDKVNSYKIILEDVKETKPSIEKKEDLNFKIYEDKSGLKVYYPKNFIVLSEENIKSLIPYGAETETLFVASNIDSSLQIIASKTNIPIYLTVDQILDLLKNINEIHGVKIKILNIKKDENPIIDEEIDYLGKKFIVKRKIISKIENDKAFLYEISIVSNEEKFKENLKTIDEIINKSGFF
ncbi:MAG: hypothetical protein ACP5JU_00490 [Minisyncoccia bacterium]